MHPILLGPPRNKGRRYPADPPTVEEIIAVMRAAGARPDGVRLRALIVVLWPAGLRIGEALALAETDLDARRGRWPGALGGGAARRQLGRTAAAAGVRRRFAPHQLRHAHAIEMADEGIPAGRHPAPARACPSRGHLDLPARDRQRRNHRRCSRPTTADDPGHRRSAHDPVVQEPQRSEPSPLLDTRHEADTAARSTWSNAPRRGCARPLRARSFQDNRPPPSDIQTDEPDDTDRQTVRYSLRRKEGSLGWRVRSRDGPRRERASHACVGVATRYRMCASRLYGPAASADGARRCTVACLTPSALSFLRIEAIAVAS